VSRTYQPPSGYKSAQVGDVSIAYKEAGSGPLVLMIHGFPDEPGSWDGIREQIADLGFRVVTPALRGYAPSSVPESGDYRPATLAADVVGLMDALGEETAHVIGHDYGAMATYLAAALAPERIKSIVTVAIPHPASLKMGLKEAWGARHFFTFRFPWAVSSFSRNDYQGIDRIFARWSPAHKWTAAELDRIKNCFASPGTAEAAIHFYRFIGDRTDLVRKRLAQPALLIGGKTDGVLDQAGFERGGRRHTGPWRLEMMEGGHFCHLEDPATFVRLVTDFLGEHAQSAATSSATATPA